MSDLQRKFLRFGTKEAPQCDSFLTEILKPYDSTSCSAEMIDAIRKKIKNLIERGTFKVILREEIPQN